jgi:uncharacterized FlgJ-related protein
MYSNPISETIYKTALADGMPETLARLLVGQSRHETGKYSSKFVKKYNSLFGYSFDKNSKYQVPGGSLADNKVPIAAYTTLEDSVHEITDWIKRRQKKGQFPKDLETIKTPLQYATYLQNCGYFQGWAKYTREQNLKFYAQGIAEGWAEN